MGEPGLLSVTLHGRCITATNDTMLPGNISATKATSRFGGRMQGRPEDDLAREKADNLLHDNAFRKWGFRALSARRALSPIVRDSSSHQSGGVDCSS
jgi:hypothetical protein